MSGAEMPGARHILPVMLSPARRLLGYADRYRRQFIFGLLCVVISTFIRLAGPWVLKYAIDDLHEGVTTEKVRFYALAMLGLAMVGGVFWFLMRRIIVGVSRDLEYDLRNDFFAHLQRFPMAFFQARRTGDLMSRATNDLSAVRMMIGPAVMYTANTTLTFVVAILLMLSIDVRLTLIALIPLPFVTISVKYFGSAIHRRFERIQAQLSDLSAVTQEALAGVRVVRAYGQERLDRTWAGWLEFHPTEHAAPILRTGQETSQPNRTALIYWATGLEPIYFEGAFGRARERAFAFPFFSARLETGEGRPRPDSAR